MCTDYLILGTLLSSLVLLNTRVLLFSLFLLRHNIHYRVVIVIVTPSYDIKKNIEDFGIDNVIQYIC